jgi:hypothetical protein
MVRRRLSAYKVDERKRGASDAEAEKGALARLGNPEQVAQELRERVLAHHARVNTQAVLVAFILVLLAMVAIAFKVLEIHRYRRGGDSYFDGRFGSGGALGDQDLFHHIRALDVYLPPRYLSLKLILSLSLIGVALVLAEFALALVHRRRRLGSWLTLGAGAALVAAVSLQIAFAFEWHRLYGAHDGWLLAAMLIEIGAVLFQTVFLVRVAGAVLVGRLAPLARAPLFALLVLAPLLAVGTKSGFSSTDLCPPDNYCGPSPEMVMEITANHAVYVVMPSGPSGAQGAVALRGRRLAAAIETLRTDSPTRSTASSPTDVVVWEGRWSASQPGPCGAVKPGLSLDRLAPTTNAWCEARGAASHRGASWRRVARLRGEKVGAVAIAYQSNGSLAVAYSRRDGVWFAAAPSWHPRRLLDKRASALKLVSLQGGDLALAAIVSRAGRSELELTRSHGKSWSRSISESARPGLSMASNGSQLALLFRDGVGRLVLERRARTLALLERKTFSERSRGALGNLRGGEIGLAISTSLQRRVVALRIFRISRAGINLLTRERLSIGAASSYSPTEKQRVHLEEKQLAGVVQTGEVVRALYGGHLFVQTAKHVVLAYFGDSESVAFASDWPRWAALARTQSEEINAGKARVRKTEFELTLAQPPEQQLKKLAP